MRVSVGDLKNIDYHKWADNPNQDEDNDKDNDITNDKDFTFSTFPKGLIVYISWGFWLINIYLI